MLRRRHCEFIDPALSTCIPFALLYYEVTEDIDLYEVCGQKALRAVCCPCVHERDEAFLLQTLQEAK